MTTITNPSAINAVRLRAQRQCVKLERLGMRHSGGNVTPRLKKHFGMAKTASYQQVLDRLDSEIKALDETLFGVAG